MEIIYSQKVKSELSTLVCGWNESFDPDRAKELSTSCGCSSEGSLITQVAKTTQFI